MKFFTFLALALTSFSWAENSNPLAFPKREYDAYGRLEKEEFSNGKSIKISYNDENQVTHLFIDGCGSISYRYDDKHLLEVSRISLAGEIAYTHTYEYDSFDGLLYEELISNLGRISYSKDPVERTVRIESPYNYEVCKLNSDGLLASHVLNGNSAEFEYDNNNQLITHEVKAPEYTLEYDPIGRLIKKISPSSRSYFEFDEFGRLIEAITNQARIIYSYDDLDRRSEKKIIKNGYEETETYLYFGNNEIAIYDGDGNLKQLRIPGLSFHNDFILPIAIEKNNQTFATIHDYQGNISKVINTDTQEVISIPPIDAFGGNLNKIALPTPWIFASKHYDAETNLVYFGSRYYDPEQKQWITPDPYGTLQHPNVYLYCLGNPVSYFDPDGKFALALPLLNLAWGAGAVLTFPAWGTAALITATGAAVGWAAYEVIQKVKDGNQRDGTPKSNGAQNTQYEDAVREIERKIGKRLDGRDRDKLHDHITGQDYGYHEIVEEGYWLFK